MNRRNVDKLAEALRACRGYVQVSGGRARIEGSVEEIARDLAGQGVLVPSALTKDQLGMLVMRTAPPLNAVQDDRELLLRNLERAAKGEGF
jgi:acetylornithine/succinyldiaminopimelate/putrescine aminotransferase